MNIILFGFTGLGSSALRALLKINDVNVTSVFTKKYNEPYPYYSESQVEDICKEMKVECHLDRKVNSGEVAGLIRQKEPDLIIVCSFNQIISSDIIRLPKLGIVNIHPSLLPSYRGPYPEQWVLFNNESKTGVTFHYLTEKLDSGNILLQKEIAIEENDDNRSLKKKSGLMIEKMMPELISLFRDNAVPEGRMQDEKSASFFPRPSPEDGYLEKETGIQMLKNRVRAFNPFPGTSYELNGTRYFIYGYELSKPVYSDDGVYLLNKAYIEVQKGHQAIRLFIKN